MRTLNRDFKLMCQRNRDGSFATQHDRERLLTMMANQLHEDGFRNLRAQGLRTRVRHQPLQVVDLLEVATLNCHYSSVI